MHFFITFLLFLSLNVFSQKESDTQVETKEINIAIGIDKTLKMNFELNADFNIGDASFIKVKPDLPKNKITLVGSKVGTTSLTLKDKSGDEKVRYIVSVTANEQSKIVSELRDLLQDVEGLKIGIRGGKVYVGGYIVVPDDIGKVSTILKNYPNVLRLIEMHPQTQRIIAKKMTEELSRFNFKNTSVRVVNNAYWVEGVVGSESEKNLVKEIVQAYLPDKIESLAASSERLVGKADSSDILILVSVNSEKKSKPEPLPKQIKISSQFVELSKDYNKVFGFQWSPLLDDGGAQVQIGRRTDGTVSTETQNGFSAIISNLLPKIQSLKSAGYGRIIQSGIVVTEDKVKGNVTKSTNFPIVLGSNDAARVISTNTTFNFDVTPEVKENDNVAMKVNISVKLPSGQGTDGQVFTTDNSIATRITVKSGQSAVVGGVVQAQDLTNYDKNPPAQVSDDQSSSVFFNMLKSKSKSLSKNQYVVFITPEIIQSASAGTAEIQRKFRRGR